ncbi:hypothetical protein CN187_30220 [Sinorhizobium meliloti]|nr:hypothetical protein CN187_30220 [Sinorhizobium meliloti]
MTRITLGRSRLREIRPPGSVRAKPNGIATRPRSGFIQAGAELHQFQGEIKPANIGRNREPRRTVHISSFSSRDSGHQLPLDAQSGASVN